MRVKQPTRAHTCPHKRTQMLAPCLSLAAAAAAGLEEFIRHPPSTIQLSVVIVRNLLEAGADTTPVIAGGWTALSAACAGGHGGAVKYLLRAGADPDQTDDFGRTLLHDAAEGCHFDVVR